MIMMEYIFFQIEKVKIIQGIPYLLPKSYAKLPNERPAAADSANKVDCQVSRGLLCHISIDKSSCTSMRKESSNGSDERKERGEFFLKKGRWRGHWGGVREREKD